MAADSSRTTHQAQEAVDACRYFAGLLIGALRGVNKGDAAVPELLPGGRTMGPRPPCREDRPRR